MNRIVSVAPMMDCTDRHERYFLRLISKNVLLYTEMIVSEAIDRGDKKKLLSFNLKEARERFEKEYLSAQIDRFSGNISRTASFIKMERSALHRKLKTLEIEK